MIRTTTSWLIICIWAFVWFGSRATAQTLPAVPDLQVQLTADAGTNTTVDGGDILDWFDQANGHFFFNANVTLPTYVANSGGGVPAIDFTRSSGFLGDFSATAGGVIGDATIFVVARFDGYTHSSGSSSYFFSIDTFGDPPNNSEHTLGRDQDGTNNDALYHWRGQPSPQAAYGTNIIEDIPGGFGDFNYYTSIFRGTDDGGGAVNEMEAWINGSSGGTATPDVTHNGSGYSATPSLTRIGLWTSGVNGLDGMMREVLIYNRVLTSQEITDVEAYLADRALSPVAPTMLLEVDRDTREINLKNVSGGNLDMSAYLVTANSESLDRSAWTSIAENYDSDSGGSVDSNNIWQELGAGTDPSLQEAALAGTATLTANQTIALGATWVPYYQEDLRLEFDDGLGQMVLADVQFSGNGGQAYEFGDLNFDGTVGIGDWTAFINGYGSDLSNSSVAAAYGLADLNADGRHTLADIQAFRGAFAAAGGNLAELTGGPVPEPSSAALLLIAAWLQTAFIRKRTSCLLARMSLRRRHAKQRRIRLNLTERLRFRVTTSLLALIIATVTLPGSVALAGLFDDVQLSPDAQNKFLIHFDAAVGVSTTGGSNVSSWAGMNGDGTATVATAVPAGSGAAANITSNGTAVVFNELNALDNLHLATPLSTSGDQYTIIWVGHYDSSNQNGAETSGLYAYSLTNLDVNNAPGMNHQRDDCSGSFCVEVYPGTTFPGDDIAAFDDTTTAWSTIYDYANGTHTTYVAETNLNLTGSSNLSLNPDPTLVIGGYDDGSYFNTSGYNILGEIEQLIIFEGLVSLTDIAAVVSFYGDALPTLQVDTNTGEITLTGGVEMRNINGYEIFSTGDSLDGASWSTSNFDFQNLDPIGTGVGESWDTLSATSSQLTEAFLLGGSSFDSNRTESLGFGYNTNVDARDLTFEYTVTDGRTLFGAIEYVDNPLSGDFDNDGDVDGADFLKWQRDLGDAPNLALWESNYGAPAAGIAGASAVPEPNTAILFSLGFFGLSLVRRRRGRSHVNCLTIPELE